MTQNLNYIKDSVNTNSLQKEKRVKNRADVEEMQKIASWDELPHPNVLLSEHVAARCTSLYSRCLVSYRNK